MLSSRTNWKSPIAAMTEFTLLKGFAQIMPEVGGSRTWRNGDFKRYHEEYQAALFTYGLNYLKPLATWEYSHNWEHKSVRGIKPIQGGGDFAVRARFSDDADWTYKYIELKEWVPQELPTGDTLQSIINKLTKYYSRDLIVAIYVNRATTISFQGLTIPKLHINQLWIYGHQANKLCFLTGDLLGPCQHYHFEYPCFPKQAA